MENIELAVKELLGANDGHGYDHVDRVRKLAIKFAKQEDADIEIVELASLLHDVDDYKLFGEECAKNLLNARKILETNNVDEKMASLVLDIIQTMGYSKSLEGIRPTTLEGQIVSDADMCDAIGAEGILRTHAYNLSRGNIFFDKTAKPLDVELSAEQYKKTSNHSVQHFFDKLLIINNVLMTAAGKEEGAKRQKIMVDFLRELFREEGAEVWQAYLSNFLARQ